MTDPQTPPAAPPAGPVHEPPELEPVRKDVGFVSKIAVTLGLVLGYLTIAVGSTSDEMLFLPDRTLELPLFRVSVPVESFYLFAPLLLVALHGYFLLERLRLATRLRETARRLSEAAEPARQRLGQPPDAEAPVVDVPVFVPAFLFRDPRLRRGNRLLAAAVWVASAISIVLPVVVLLLVQWAYLPSRHGLTRLHQAAVTIDLLMICAFMLLTFQAARRSTDGGGLLRRAAFVALLLAVFLPITWICMTHPKPGDDGGWWSHHLDLRAWHAPETTGAVPLSPRLGDLCNARFNDAGLAGFDLAGADLRGAELRRADLRGADLRNARLDGADLTDADFTGADLRGASLVGARARLADFSGALLVGASMQRLEAREAVFFAADLRHARLTAANLVESDLRLTDLTGAWLLGTRLVQARLTGAVFDSPPPLSRGADLRGADLRWAEGLPSGYVDLRNTDLRGADTGRVDALRMLLAESRSGIEESDARAVIGLQVDLDALREDRDAFLQRHGDLLGEERRDRLRRRLRGRQVTQQAPLDLAGVPLSPTAMAREVGNAACSDQAMLDHLLARVRGEQRPLDRTLERALARRLLDLAADERCAYVERRVAVVRRSVCGRWAAEPPFAASCR